jgi:NAD(P)-dependent dehydrogenase (short-subunit alcohol dehydrogenase family)
VTYDCHCAAGKSEQAEALADYAVSQLQRVDIWVNNAGASQPTKGDLVDSDPAVMQVGSMHAAAPKYGSASVGMCVIAAAVFQMLLVVGRAGSHQHKPVGQHLRCVPQLG